MIIKPVSIELVNSFIFWTIIGLVLNLLQLRCNENLYVSGSITSTPYPDANAKPTITTKLENLSDLHRSSISSTTTSTEGYLNTFNDDDKYGKYNNDMQMNWKFCAIYELWICWLLIEEGRGFRRPIWIIANMIVLIVIECFQFHVPIP